MARVQKYFLLTIFLFIGITKISIAETYTPTDNNGAVIFLSPGQKIDLVLSYYGEYASQIAAGSPVFDTDGPPLTVDVMGNKVHVRKVNSFCSDFYHGKTLITLWADMGIIGVDTFKIYYWRFVESLGGTRGPFWTVVVLGDKKHPKCNGGLAGNPVSSYYGDKRITENDLTYKDLSLNRYYKNGFKDKSDSGKYWRKPLGFTGWDHNWNMYVRKENVTTGDTIIAFDGANDWVKYIKISGINDYRSEREDNSRLSAITGGGWNLYKPDGSRYRYNSYGRLDSILLLNRRHFKAFNYADSAQLDSVTNTEGQKITFRYMKRKNYPKTDSLLLLARSFYDSAKCFIEYRYDSTRAGWAISQVLQHTNPSDSVKILNRYYYDGFYKSDLGAGKISTISKSINYADTTYRGSRKKGDRLCCWNDTTNKVCYQEMIKGDNDTNYTDDQITYKAYFDYRFSPNADTTKRDSTIIYYWEGEPITGAHDPSDTLFKPKDSLSAWTAGGNKYFKKTYIYRKDGTTDKEIMYDPIKDSSYVTAYDSLDQDFNVRKITDPNGSILRQYYPTYTNPGDDSTRYWPSPWKIRYPNGDSVLTYFSAKGDSNHRLPDSTIDEAGKRTYYYYDASNNYVDTATVYKSRVLADGEGSSHDVAQRYHYNSKGNLTETLDPLEHKTIMHYTDSDTGQYLIEQRIDMGTAGEGNEDIVTQYGYNLSQGTMDTMTFYRDYPNNPSRTFYTYDVNKRLVKTVYPDTSRDSMIYDLRGNLLKKITIKTDTLYKAVYEYDPHDHLTKLKEYRSPNDSANAYDSTLYAYNLHDRMITQTNPLGKTTNYTYCMDRLVKTTYPDDTYDSLGYWAGGDLKFKLDRKGQVTYYQYDGYSSGCGCMSSSRSRLAKKYYYDSLDQYVNGFAYPSDSVTYEYDQVGNRTKMVDKNGTTVYSYDGLYRLQSDSCGYLNTKNRYQYDMAGNRTKLKVYKGDDTTTCYLDQTYKHYDNANRVDTVQVGGFNYIYSYWDVGAVKRISYPTYGYYLYEDYWLTPRGLVDSMKTSYNEEGGSAVWYRNRYVYNGLGDRTSHYVYMTRPGTTALSGTVNYTYDGLRRLKQVKNPTGFNGGDTITYSYDKAGNRTYKDSKKVSDITYNYNAANNQLTSYTGSMTFAYDGNGNMSQQSFSYDWTRSYNYDYENRLTKVYSNENYDSTMFYYNGDGQRLKKVGTKDSSLQYIPDGMYAAVERRTNGNLKYKYVYANGLLLARIDSAGNVYQYQHNALGSVIGVNDMNSSVYKSYLYDEFGDSIGTWGSSPYNSYRYTGQEYDGNPVYAYNLRAREYYPKLGRFMQNDPIGDNGGSLNWYLYVENNPMNNIDPLGLKSCINMGAEQWHNTDITFGSWTFSGATPDYNFAGVWAAKCIWLRKITWKRWSYIKKRCWSDCSDALFTDEISNEIMGEIRSRNDTKTTNGRYVIGPVGNDLLQCRHPDTYHWVNISVGDALDNPKH